MYFQIFISDTTIFDKINFSVLFGTTLKVKRVAYFEQFIILKNPKINFSKFYNFSQLLLILFFNISYIISFFMDIKILNLTYLKN